MITQMDPILIFSLALPIAAAGLTAVLNKRASLYVAVISFLPLIGYSLYGIFADLDYLVPIGALPSPIGGMYLINDGLSNSFGFTIALVTAMIAIVSEPYMEHRFRALGIGGEEFKIYYPLFILCGISMEWIVYAYNLLLMYIGLEVSLISSFLLIYFYGYDGYGKTRQWIGTLYFVYTHVASVLFLIGSVIVALTTGTMDLAAIRYVRRWLGR